MGELVTGEFWLLFAVGFFAQSIDGVLGMAFGVIATSAMLTIGLPPAHASAVVHTAEVFTTGASAASHIYHRNVDWRLVVRLGVAGVVGAVLGAWLLSNIDSRFMLPYVAAYLLLIGIFILLKAGRMAPARDAPANWVAPVGFTAGFLDASGGGGWGPVTTSTLIGSGHAPRLAIGSVNTTEFFVTVAASATFFIELGLTPLKNLIPLVLGGLIAAPFSGWAVKKVPARPLMVGVGALVIVLACWQLARSFRLI